MAEQTSPLESGLGTSEGKLTIALCLVGVALQAFAALLTQKMAEYPDTKWIAITALVVGSTTQVFTLLGYTKGRSALKANTIVSGLAAGIPIVVTAVGNAFIKNLPPAIQTKALEATTAQAIAAARAEGPQVAATARGLVATQSNSNTEAKRGG